MTSWTLVAVPVDGSLPPPMRISPFWLCSGRFVSTGGSSSTKYSAVGPAAETHKYLAHQHICCCRCNREVTVKYGQWCV